MLESDFPEFERAKAEVVARTSYGMRWVLFDHPGYLVRWSNANVQWYVQPAYWHKGTKLVVDADTICLYGSLAKCRRVAGSLPMLPLYGGAWEAGR